MNELTNVLNYTKSTLNKTEYKGTIKDEKEFYFLVRENGLTGMLFESINKDNISSKLYNNLRRDFFEYINSDNKHLLWINKLKEIFNKNEIKHIFLKGSNLKHMYPKTYMRAMGDIDVLILEKDLNKVNTLFKSLNIKLTSKSISHHVYETLDNVNLEIHPRLYTDINKYNEFLKDPFKYSSKENELTYKFNTSYELTYLIFHLEKHIKAGGIGLRSVLDIGIFIKNNSFDEELLEHFIKLNDMESFFKSIVYLNYYLFDLKVNLNIMKDFKMDNKLLNDLTKHITIAGIHGTGRDHNPFESRVISDSDSKFKFLMKRLFPSYKEMTGFYPILKKLPILLPVMYIIRFISVVFINFKTNLRKLIKTNKIKDTDKTKDIFKKIGL